MKKHKGFSPPWKRAEWQDEVRAWIEARLDEHDLTIAGPVEQTHVRPWSTVIRIPTEQGLTYFKAGAPNQRFEPALMQLLYKYQPEVSLHVLGADRARGWMLLPDGMRTLRQASEEKVTRTDWETLLRRFAELQMALTPHIAELLAAGTPDYRSAVLPSFLDEMLARKDLLLIDEEDGLTEEEFELLLNKRTELQTLCATLANTGLPPSLDHGDLHDANVFSNNGTFTFFDWGDASITHPFVSLMIPLRVLGNKLDIEDELHPDLEWARQAYLQTWTDYVPLKELREIFRLALHVGKFQRSIIYFVMMKQLAPDAIAKYKDYLPGWLKEFLGHD